MNNLIEERRIRIAVVGCGRISKNHFESIEKHAGEQALMLINLSPEYLNSAVMPDPDPASMHPRQKRIVMPGSMPQVK